MKIFTKLRLDLFGDGGSGAAPAGASGGNATAGSPSADATNTGVATEVAGSAAENTEKTNAEGSKPEAQAKTREERRKAYDTYINGEGKEFFVEDTKDIVSKRVKGEKELKAQVDKLNPFVEAIADKYNLDPSDLDGLMNAIQGDRDFFAEAAAEAGMDSPETYRKFKESERKAKAYEAEQKRVEDERVETERQNFANAKLAEWQKEAEAVKAMHPNFDFATESQDKQFMQMLRVGVSVEAAYQAKHHSEILRKAVDDAKAETEKAVVENIRAKGQRPVEGGANATSAPQTGFDVRTLTKEQRAEFARQAAFGRRIDFK